MAGMAQGISQATLAVLHRCLKHSAAAEDASSSSYALHFSH